MPKKRYNAGEIIYNLWKADVLLDQIFQARSGDSDYVGPSYSVLRGVSENGNRGVANRTRNPLLDDSAQSVQTWLTVHRSNDRQAVSHARGSCAPERKRRRSRIRVATARPSRW